MWTNNARISFFASLVALLTVAALTGCRAGAQDDPDTRDGSSVSAMQVENACGGRCGDEELQRWITGIGLRIERTLPERHRGKNALSFVAVNTRRINAHALSDGHILLTRGLLESVSSEDELAAVIAHEIAHITLGHCAARLRRTEKRAEGAGTILPPYTADQETEAAQRAAFYLARIDIYNPYALADILRALDNSDDWPRSHPPEKRGADTVARFIRGRYPEFKSNTARRPLPRRIVVLKEKAAKYYAVFERAQEVYRAYIAKEPGTNARTLNTAVGLYDTAVELAEAAQDLPAQFLAGRGVARMKLAKLYKLESGMKEARADFDRAKNIDPNCCLARLHRGKMFHEIDKFYGPAREELLVALRCAPTDRERAPVCYYLARLYEDPKNPFFDKDKAAQYYRDYRRYAPDGRSPESEQSASGG